MLRFVLAGLLSAAMAQAWAQERIMLAGVEASRDSGYAYLGAVLPLPGNRLGQGVVQRYWPVEGADKIDLVVNLKTANLFGLTVPEKVLLRADRLQR